ncbi:MAG: 2-oxoacid:acceptor oxidoreductase family protein [Desulfobacteraceae bacterium]|nr:2-oxoacid:acceptor oxidoreductase family protein [Desulfobacteraceae bacterium]
MNSKNGNTLSIAVAGLSGQGVIMFTKVLMAAFKDDSEYTIRTYEVLGTAHRGTLIFTHCRISRSPNTSFIISPGGADILVGFEPLEAFRVGAYYLKDGGQVITNDYRIIPVYASIGKDFFSDQPRPRGYPALEEIFDEFSKMDCRVTSFNATKAAIDLGHFAMMNMIMLGATLETGLVPITVEQVEEKIDELAPKGTADLNIKALHKGSELFKQSAVN